MATVNCPHRHRWISELPGKVIFEFRTVEIFADVCSSCHKCGFAACEYFDQSEEAQKRSWRAWIATHANPLAQIEDEHYERMLREKHRKLYGNAKAS